MIGDTPSSGSDYIEGIQDYVDGKGSPSVMGTAAAQAALGLIWRSFLKAEVTPVRPETAALTPELLAMIARHTMAYGNSVTEIRVSRAGLVTLLPVPVFKVSGGFDSANWQYALKRINQDEEEIDSSVPAAGIIHTRYSASAAAPWHGRGPLQEAGLTSSQLAEIERATLHDSSTPVAHILAVPDQSTAAQRLAIAAGIKSGKGNVRVEATTAGGYGAGGQAAPARRDYETTRIGPNIPATSLAARDGSALAVEAALGVPAGMFSQNAGATREGLRMFFAFTLDPLATLIESELQQKLEIPDLRVSLQKLRAHDVTATARALGASYVSKRGCRWRIALELVGLPDVDLTPDPNDETFQV